MRYISQEVKEKIMQAKPGTVILLKAQVGSGKTTFCINDLWKHCKTNKKKLLLLVNRSALRGQLRQSILKSIGLKGNVNMEERGILEFEGLTVTTYQYLQNVFGEVYELGRRKIGALAAENFDYVVADEIHYLFRFHIFRRDWAVAPDSKSISEGSSSIYVCDIRTCTRCNL